MNKWFDRCSVSFCESVEGIMECVKNVQFEVEVVNHSVRTRS